MAASAHSAPLCRDSFLAGLDRTSFPPSPDPSQRFVLWLAGFFADSIWIYQSWQESSQVLRAIYTTARGSCIWLAGRILCASKSNVVAAMIWIGVHARARFYSSRRVVPSPTANHPPVSTLRSFRIPNVATHEAFREPVRHPLGCISGEVSYPVGTAAI